MIVALALAACGGEEITEYQPEDRNEFLQACTLPGEDPILITSVCGCVFDELTGDLAYAEFRELSASLDLEESPTALDPDLAGAMGSCLAARVTGQSDTQTTTVDNLD